MRGRKSKYYDYNKAESLSDLRNMNGCDTIVYRSWLDPMFEGDLLVVFPDDKWWTDEDENDHLMFPDIEYVSKLKTHILRDMRNFRRWVSRFVTEFTDNPIVFEALKELDAVYDRAHKKQKELGSVTKQKYSWYENNHGTLTAEDMIMGTSDEMKKEALDYSKMVGREYRQLNWVMMMREVLMPKYEFILRAVLDQAKADGRENETIQFRIDEYNRLKKQTRQEQERKIK